ncbi:Methionine synthase [Methanocaldococcus lauensis]|uniref:Methionine synthase n=1 Tax=Methanocaldococcus lauensis TaxID=2546128 RepID=A0A8D6PY53_9EURY|nr:methionine synthase [Methanocaldococcus lauensis]CAB3289475.1 Methionine synthase [Methanocaldococcus lauensis]
MITTVVGSYPVVKKEETFFDKVKKVFGLYDEYKYAIEKAVIDQVNAGIDIISEGQVRGDMIEIFTNKMYGFDGKRVIGKIEFIEPITVKDVLYAKNIAKKLNPKVEVKGIITGPCTISSSVRVENYYTDNRDENLIYDIAKALRKEVEELKKYVSIIQIDEPILSTGLYDFDIARKAIDIIVKDLNIKFAMHVCGNVYNIIEELNKFNVDILDHEFASNRKNLDILESIKKKVGFGCVNTKVKSVESVDEIKSLIEEGLEILKNNENLNKNLFENILIDPDCGMRLLPIDVAFNKLKNMVKATKLIKSEFSSLL